MCSMTMTTSYCVFLLKVLGNFVFFMISEILYTFYRFMHSIAQSCYKKDARQRNNIHISTHKYVTIRRHSTNIYIYIYIYIFAEGILYVPARCTIFHIMWTPGPPQTHIQPHILQLTIIHLSTNYKILHKMLYTYALTRLLYIIVRFFLRIRRHVNYFYFIINIL